MYDPDDCELQTSFPGPFSPPIKRPWERGWAKAQGTKTLITNYLGLSVYLCVRVRLIIVFSHYFDPRTMIPTDLMPVPFPHHPPLPPLFPPLSIKVSIGQTATAKLVVWWALDLKSPVISRNSLSSRVFRSRIFVRLPRWLESRDVSWDESHLFLDQSEGPFYQGLSSFSIESSGCGFVCGLALFPLKEWFQRRSRLRLCKDGA